LLGFIECASDNAEFAHDLTIDGNLVATGTINGQSNIRLRLTLI
jgi:hypothetical protein